MRTLMCWFPPPVSVVRSLTVQRAWARSGGRFGKDVFDVVAPTNQMQVRIGGQGCLAGWDWCGDVADAVRRPPHARLCCSVVVLPAY